MTGDVIAGIVIGDHSQNSLLMQFSDTIFSAASAFWKQ
jgi:hypothetical protein